MQTQFTEFIESQGHFHSFLLLVLPFNFKIYVQVKFQVEVVLLFVFWFGLMTSFQIARTNSCDQTQEDFQHKTGFSASTS